MQALSEKGTALLAKFKKFQKLSLVLYALAAMAFVFAGNILLAIIIVALDIFQIGRRRVGKEFRSRCSPYH